MLSRIRRHLQNPTAWQIVLACYWLVLFGGTHVPSDTPGVPGPVADKVVHLIAFAILAALFTATWERTAGRLFVRHFIWAWLILAVYAAVDEWTQTFVGRTGGIDDWLADAAGAAIGLAIFALLRSKD